MRLYLTRREYEALLEKQGGTCCVPGCEENEGLIGEHSIPNKWKLGKPDQLMCVTCHKVKTRRDMKVIWKVKRINGETLGQFERRKLYGSQFRSRNSFYRKGSRDPKPE